MKLSTALRLGRVSNLPTVTSNVLAATALSSGYPTQLHVAAVCVAMSLMYVAGMFLNDAFDRDIDARERPERPIPSGEVSAREVFDVGFGLLGGAIALVAVIAMVTHRGWAPVMCAVGLASTIIFYNAYHKQNPASPLVMGLCRVGVYATAAFAATRGVDAAIWRGMAALLCYLIGLTYIARQENLSRVDNLWPLAVMAIPAWLALPDERVGWICYISWLICISQALRELRRRAIREAVGLLIAGIALLDGAFAAKCGAPVMAINCIVAYGLTRWLQSQIAGT